MDERIVVISALENARAWLTFASESENHRRTPLPDMSSEILLALVG